MEKSIDQQIADLQAQKAREEKQKVNDHKNAQKKLWAQLPGKCFKRVQTWKGQGHRSCREVFHWVEYIYFQKVSNCDWLYLIERVELQISPSGWQFVPSRSTKGLELKYHHGRNYFSPNPNRENRYYQRVKLGKEGSDGELFNLEHYEVAEDLSSITAVQATSNNAPFHQVDKAEYIEATTIANDQAQQFYERLKRFVGNDYSKDEEYSDSIPELTPTFLKQLSDFLSDTNTGKIPTTDMLKQMVGKVARYNYFDSNNKLPELVQYNQYGDKGLNLKISSGDGGTDYEPYVTHYYISDVSIDWPHILYPIRQKLDCGVLELAEELSNLSQVYISGNWECNYDSSGYDATFWNAKLKSDVLDKVNETITSHIK